MNNQHEPETLWQPAKPADQDAPIQPQRKLTPKQTAWIKHLIENPKASYTAAAKAVYGKPDKELTTGTAQQIAYENMRKPNVMTELAKYTGQAELVIMEVMEQSRKEMYKESKEAVAWAVNARQTADSLLDRVRGKATIKTESVSTSVNLNLNLANVVGDVVDTT